MCAPMTTRSSTPASASALLVAEHAPHALAVVARAAMHDQQARRPAAPPAAEGQRLEPAQVSGVSSSAARRTGVHQDVFQPSGRRSPRASDGEPRIVVAADGGEAQPRDAFDDGVALWPAIDEIARDHHGVGLNPFQISQNRFERGQIAVQISDHRQRGGLWLRQRSSLTPDAFPGLGRLVRWRMHSRALLLADVDAQDLVAGLAVALRVALAEAVDHIHPADDLAEDGVLAVQMRRWGRR